MNKRRVRAPGSGRRGFAGRARHLSEQLAAVLRWRSIEPAPAGPEEAALVGKAEQVGRLRKREMKPPEILLRELAARVVEKLPERRRFLLKAPLQGALAHAQLARDLIPPRLAVGQAADDHLTRPIAGLGVIETPEVVAGKALMQLGQDRAGGGQRRAEVGACKEQAVARRVEGDRAAEGGAVGLEIERCGIHQFDPDRVHLAPGDPAAKADHRDENELDALARHRPVAAQENEAHAATRTFLAHRHGEGVAEDEQIANEALEGGAQIGARHHGVTDHVEARGPRDPMLGEPDRGIARALGGELPELADPLRRQAPRGSLELRALDPGLGQQRTHVEAFRGQHLRDTFHPDGGRRRLAHPPPLPAAQVGTLRLIDWPPRSLTRAAPRSSVLAYGPFLTWTWQRRATLS